MEPNYKKPERKEYRKVIYKDKALVTSIPSVKTLMKVSLMKIT